MRGVTTLQGSSRFFQLNKDRDHYFMVKILSYVGSSLYNSMHYKYRKYRSFSLIVFVDDSVTSNKIKCSIIALKKTLRIIHQSSVSVFVF